MTECVTVRRLAVSSCNSVQLLHDTNFGAIHKGFYDYIALISKRIRTFMILVHCLHVMKQLPSNKRRDVNGPDKVKTH